MNWPQLISHNITTKVTRWDSVNRYRYNPYGLFIPFALANVYTLATLLLGFLSAFRDGVFPGKKFGDIVRSANPNIVADVRDRRRSMTADSVGGQMFLR